MEGPALLIERASIPVTLCRSQRRARQPFPLPVCFAGPCRLLLKVFSLKMSSALLKGVCKNKHIQQHFLSGFALKKKTQQTHRKPTKQKPAAWLDLVFEVIDKSALPSISVFFSCLFLAFWFCPVQLQILDSQTL